MEGTVKFNLHGISYDVACLVVHREDGAELSLTSYDYSLIPFYKDGEQGEEAFHPSGREYAERILSFLDGKEQ